MGSLATAQPQICDAVFVGNIFAVMLMLGC